MVTVLLSIFDLLDGRSTRGTLMQLFGLYLSERLLCNMNYSFLSWAILVKFSLHKDIKKLLRKYYVMMLGIME